MGKRGFSSERETIVERAGPFSVERLKIDLFFVQCFVCTQRSAGPLGVAWNIPALSLNNACAWRGTFPTPDLSLAC